MANENEQLCLVITREIDEKKDTSANIQHYNGWFYNVPEPFQFPNVILSDTIPGQCLGQTVSKDWLMVVTPFYKTRLLHIRLQHVYEIQWICILSHLEKGIALLESNANNPMVLNSKKFTILLFYNHNLRVNIFSHQSKSHELKHFNMVYADKMQLYFKARSQIR